MKNIMVIESDRDNQGVSLGFIESLDEIKDDLLRSAVVSAIENKQFESKVIFDSRGSLGGESIRTGEKTIYTTGIGCVFQEFRKPLPYTVEHIIEHLID